MDADDQLVVLVKGEAWCGVDQQDPEHLHIKEEQEDLSTSLEGEQLNLKETDGARFPFTDVSIKSEDDEEKPLLSQLQQHKIEDGDVPTSSSAEQMTAVTGGRAKTSRKPDHTCHYCGKVCKYKSALNNHIRVHTGEKPFACYFCSGRFSSKGSLKNHLRRHMEPKTLACKICKEIFSHKSKLQIHMKVHKENESLTCKKCKEIFSHKSKLKSHMKVHKVKKFLACKKCKKRFSHKSKLNNHMKVHTGQKPFGCELCGQRFSKKASLNNHMRVHTDKGLLPAPLTRADMGVMLQGLEDRITSRLSAQFAINRALLEQHDSTIQQLKTAMNDMNNRMLELETTCSMLMQENENLKLNTDDPENWSRCNSIHMTGL